MDKAIARLNVEYLCKKLYEERDPVEREKTLKQLIAEEAKLGHQVKPPSCARKK